MIYTVLPWRPGRCWTCDLPSTAEGSWSSFWLALTGFVQQRWLAGLPLAPPPLSVRPVWLDEKHLSVITHHVGHSGLYFLLIQIYFYFILLYFYVTFSCSWIQLIKSEHLLLLPVLHRLRLLLLPISPLCRLLSNLEIKKQISKTFPSCESLNYGFNLMNSFCRVWRSKPERFSNLQILSLSFLLQHLLQVHLFVLLRCLEDRDSGLPPPLLPHWDQHK